MTFTKLARMVGVAQAFSSFTDSGQTITSEELASITFGTFANWRDVHRNEKVSPDQQAVARDKMLAIASTSKSFDLWFQLYEMSPDGDESKELALFGLQETATDSTHQGTLLEIARQRGDDELYVSVIRKGAQQAAERLLDEGFDAAAKLRLS